MKSFPRAIFEVFGLFVFMAIVCTALAGVMALAGNWLCDNADAIMTWIPKMPERGNE